MPYRDSIPKAVEDKIVSWGLSTRLFRLLMETLQFELRTREVEEYPRQINAPVRCLVLPISIVDPETAETRDFVFWINSTEDPGVRIVIDCCDRARDQSGEPTGRQFPADSD